MQLILRNITFIYAVDLTFNYTFIGIVYQSEIGTKCVIRCKNNVKLHIKEKEDSNVYLYVKSTAYTNVKSNVKLNIKVK